MTPRLVSGTRQIEVSTVAERAARAATGLESECGVSPGDAIALFMRNDFPYFEVTAAANLLGAYAVPINWHYTAEEAGYILENSGAKAVVVHADLLGNIEAGIPDSVSVFVVETPPEVAAAYGVKPALMGLQPGHRSWDDWLAGFAPMTPRNVAAPGSMIYTSGTTGRPKGVRRTPASPEQMALLYETINRAFGLRPGGRTVIPAPLYHSAPNAYALLTLAHEMAEVVLMPRFDPEALLQVIEAHKITHLQTVPTMFVRLLKLPEEVRKRYDVSSLEFVVHAAAPCPDHVKRAMIEWWGPVVHEYYGATEVGSVVFCTAEEWLAHPGSVGRAMPGVELRVLNDEGEDQPIGVPGEVFCRLLKGTDFTYHGDDAKRRRAERHGLISVGDIGYLDADGFLYLCDRANDMVISGGVNIYPAEIESCLIGHPAIADCAVFGIPDEDFGEALCACIQIAPGANLDEEAVRAHVRANLASYKVPKIVQFLDDLPREDSGKIFKRKLREPFWEGQDRRI